MNKPIKLFTKIITGFDRIDFSIPSIYLAKVLKVLKLKTTKFESYIIKSYWYKKYNVAGCRITVRGIMDNGEKLYYFDRFFLSLYDPDYNVQIFLKHELLYIVRATSKDKPGILLKQVEVSFDFYPANGHTAEEIKKVIDHHLTLRYARAGSDSTFKTTNYIGCNGNVRKGSKGSRSYVKDENGKHFYRFEMQYNRPYLIKNNITFDSLPLNPQSFHVFDDVQLLDDFSVTGIRNVSRSLLRKDGITPGTDTDFSVTHQQKMDELKSQVIGKAKGRKRKVSSQLAQLKSLSKDSGLSINCKQYFQPMENITQLIRCHADIGYLEENCSKRMIFCQL